MSVDLKALIISQYLTNLFGVLSAIKVRCYCDQLFLFPIDYLVIAFNVVSEIFGKMDKMFSNIANASC